MNNKTILLFLFLIANLPSVFSQSRPQEPQEPFAYNSENIIFENKIDSVSLAGTFTYPKSGSDFPTVILISGSGSQDRNSEVLNHKPFLVIADYLTNNGIAVLRVDDRGNGESEGVHNETGLDGFVRDTKSAVDYLKARKEVNQAKIGLIGHSLGGVIAPIVASESNDISFIVILAGSGIRGDKLMLLQKEIIERKMSIPEVTISIGQKNMKGAYDIILASNNDIEKLETDLKEYFTRVFGAMLPENQIHTFAKKMTIPWFTDFIKFDPINSLSKTKCAVLAINGTNDLQVPAKRNLESIEQILKENGNTDVETIEMENLNHLFQESETGLSNEYGTIEQTFSPTALTKMNDWIMSKIK